MMPPDERLLQLARACSVGRWHVSKEGNVVDDDYNEVAVCEDGNDAKFIAAADPATVIDLVRRVRAERARIKTLFERLREELGPHLGAGGGLVGILNGIAEMREKLGG